MTYIVNMASGKPYPDDELVHCQEPVAQHPHPDPGTAYPRLQLATPHPTHMDRSSATIAAGLNITALLRFLED